MFGDFRSLIALCLTALTLGVAIVALAAPKDATPLGRSISSAHSGIGPANQLSVATAAVAFRYGSESYIRPPRSTNFFGGAGSTFAMEP